jgi:predicted deacylase
VLAADVPRRGVLRFLYGVSKEQMCEAWDEGLAANTPGAPADVEAGFERLCSLMADVEKGDEIAFTYLPGRGTEISVRGQSQGTIAGKPFADALFACWLGPKPGPGEDFKRALLGAS